MVSIDEQLGPASGVLRSLLDSAGFVLSDGFSNNKPRTFAPTAMLIEKPYGMQEETTTSG